MIKTKYGETGSLIVKGLSKGFDIVLSSYEVFSSPGFGQLAKVFGATSRADKQKLKRNIASLKKRGLVGTTFKKGATVYFLTKKGQRESERLSLDDIKIKKPKKWDRKWRIVMFDIPEKLKKVRMEINFRLQDFGMEQYQKSTFITPYDCKKEVIELQNFFNIKRYLKYIVAEKIDDEEAYKARFGL